MVAFYSPLSHCHNMVTFIYHLNRRILQLGYLKPSLPQDPKAVLNCSICLECRPSLSNQLEGCLLKGLNFLAPKLIPNLLGEIIQGEILSEKSALPGWLWPQGSGGRKRFILLQNLQSKENFFQERE